MFRVIRVISFTLFIAMMTSCGSNDSNKCRIDGDCPWGYFCYEATCTFECAKDDECAQGNWKYKCDTQDGKCVLRPCIEWCGAGCCDKSDKCIKGTTDTACGVSGGLCKDCSDGYKCRKGVWVDTYLKYVCAKCEDECGGCCNGDKCNDGESDWACGEAFGGKAPTCQVCSMSTGEHCLPYPGLPIGYDCR